MLIANVLDVYQKCAKYPFGKTFFSYLFSVKAPYFLNLRASVEDLKPGAGMSC